jgi:hypothetical protein
MVDCQMVILDAAVSSSKLKSNPRQFPVVDPGHTKRPASVDQSTVGTEGITMDKISFPTELVRNVNDANSVADL